ADDRRVAAHLLVNAHLQTARPTLVIEPGLGVVDRAFEAAPLEDELGRPAILLRHALRRLIAVDVEPVVGRAYTGNVVHSQHPDASGETALEQPHQQRGRDRWEHAET